ncbi:MAG: glycosyltransferase [Oscillospiraceae bacterium]|nr:glycosyltransferase [Oscillospiraceae bacterium]
MSELISVVVPIYKVEKYLPNCIESILQQTYCNLEIILVDDGSPDNCGKICDEYAKKDDRIRVIHKPNGGLSDARNAGIDIATGEYITFIDSDDFILPDMLKIMMNLLLEEKADLVECRRLRCKENDTLKSTKVLERNIQFATYTGNDKMKVFFQKDGSDTTAWGKIYKTSLFENIRYPKGKIHEDVFTTYQLIHRAEKLVLTEYAGYVYRENSNSITGAIFSEKKLDAIEGKIQQADFIAEYYPELKQSAYASIIYACNQCLIGISQSGYKKKETLDFIQENYRKYGKYYLKSKKEIYKKIICLLAMADVKIAKLFLQALKKGC